jgi:hypothetical protein
MELSTDFDQVIEALTAKLARRKRQPPSWVRPAVRALVVAAREQYRTAGAPYGDHGPGFLVWLLERNAELRR